MSKLVQNHSNTTNQTSCTCIQLLSDVPVHPSMHDKPFVLAAPRDGFPTKVRVLSTNLTNSNCSVGPTFVTQTTIHEPVHKTTNKLSWKQAESFRPLFKFIFTLWNKVAKKETLENVKWELETRWELPSVRGTGLKTGRWKIFTAEKKLIKIISTTKS